VRLVDDGTKVQVIGSIRNDGSEIYSGINIIGTFFDSKGIRHHPPYVNCACELLSPGESCPFIFDIYVRDYTKYKLHPEGTPVQYIQPLVLVTERVSAANDGIGNVRFTGIVHNPNAVTVYRVLVIGELVDATGQTVSLDSVAILGDIAPGAEAPFEMRVKYIPYAHYQLSAQGVQK
jgi:hypothetical protein